MAFIERFERSAPYHNDYDEADGYISGLFKPGVALQARELNFVQAMLQDQIGRFANHIFRNGSPVTGAESNISVANEETATREVVLTPGIVYFDKRFVRVNNNEIDTGKFTIDVPTGKTNFGVDPVTTMVGIIDADSTEIQVVDGSKLPDTGAVLIEEEIVTYTSNLNNTLSGLVRGAHGTTAATHAHTPDVRSLPQREGKRQDGTIFKFTYNGQSADVANENPSSDDEYGTWFNSNNFLVGLKVTKFAVNSKGDQRLLDISRNTPNRNAPGADRLKVVMELDIRPLNQEYADFIRLIEYKNGEKVRKVVGAQYADLMRYFARSYDEIFGDFSVIPHRLSVTDWSNAELEANEEREGSFALNISPGKTYVSGYPREYLGPTRLSLDSGRTSLSANFNNAIQSVFYDWFDVRIDGTPGPIHLDKIFQFTIDVGSPAPTYRAWVRQVVREGIFLRIYFSDPSPNFKQNFKAGLAISFFNSEDPSNLGTATATGTIETAINQTNGKMMLYEMAPNAVNFRDLQLYTKVYQSNSIPGGGSPGDVAVLDNVLVGEVDPSSANQYKLPSPDPGQDTFVIDDNGNVIVTGFTLAASGGGINQIQWSSAPPASNYRVYYKSNAFGADTIGLEVTELRDTNATTNMVAPTADTSMDVDQLLGGSPSFYDVYKINSITDGTGAVYLENRDFMILTGITSQYYYASGIRWFRGRKRPASTYTIDFNYWTHFGSAIDSANGSFITPDSFKDSTGSNTRYINIPGNRHSIVDMRTRNNQVSIVNDVWTTGDNSRNTMDIRKRTRRPITNSPFGIDHQRYLPRYDTVVIDKDGKFQVFQGQPKANPDKPKHPPNSLLLGHIRIPAYARSAGDIVIYPWKSQRYTQQDIRLLEERITALERITINNKLELLALNQKLNPSDTLRGVLVDDFSGHGVADTNNPEYDAGIDPETGSLRLPFEFEHYDIDLTKGDAGPNIRFNENTITLDFTESVYIENPYATGSENVNPFDTFTWIGILKVTPRADQWTDTNGQPAIIEDFNLTNSHFEPNNPVPGWDREVNFAQRRIWGLPVDSIRPNGRFEGQKPTTVTESQVRGRPQVADRGDGAVESELRRSGIAWNSKVLRNNELATDAV